MAGLWELPGGEIQIREEGKDRLYGILVDRVGLATEHHQSVGRIEHIFTHRRLRLDIFRCIAVRGARVRTESYAASEWIRPEALLERAHAGSTRKALALLGVTNETSARRAGRLDE